MIYDRAGHGEDWPSATESRRRRKERRQNTRRPYKVRRSPARYKSYSEGTLDSFKGASLAISVARYSF